MLITASNGKLMGPMGAVACYFCARDAAVKAGEFPACGACAREHCGWTIEMLLDAFKGAMR